MRRIAYFVGLKISEIAGIVAVYYFLCLASAWIFPQSVSFWAGGIKMCFCILVLATSCGMAVLALSVFVKANWRVAGKLAARRKSENSYIE